MNDMILMKKEEKIGMMIKMEEIMKQIKFIIIIFVITINIIPIEVHGVKFHTGYSPLEYKPEKRQEELLRSRAYRRSRYDPRDEGMITPIKDQGETEACWAFSTIAMAEANLLKQSLVDKSIDLSEHHLTYFMYNSSNDPLSNTSGDQSVLKNNFNYLNAGGNYYFSFQFLSGFSGLVNEETVSSIPYTYKETQTIDKSLQFKHNSYTLKNTYYSIYDIETIKDFIERYGAVGMSYQYVNDTQTMNFEHNAIYNPDGDVDMANHSVTIVGWDDDYDKNNFTISPQHNGAWLIKNSWGEIGSESGYFWMSYEEPSITDVVAAEFEKAKYDYNYHYDGNLSPTYISIEDELTYANVYQVKGNDSEYDELLKAVQIAVQSTDTAYSIQIYRNIKYGEDPTSGTLVNQQPIKGKTTYSGLYTIELEEPITLAQGDYYSIVVTLKKPHHAVKMFVEKYQDSYWVELKSGMKENQSFYYDDGKWNDLSYENITARIKGLTVNAKTKSAFQISLPDTQSMTIGQMQKMNIDIPSQITHSKLIWQSSQPDVVSVDDNGYITAVSLGEAVITVTTEYGSTASCLVKVSDNKSTNHSNDSTKYVIKQKTKNNVQRTTQNIVETFDTYEIERYILLMCIGLGGFFLYIDKQKYLYKK